MLRLSLGSATAAVPPPGASEAAALRSGSLASSSEQLQVRSRPCHAFSSPQYNKLDFWDHLDLRDATAQELGLY